LITSLKERRARDNILSRLRAAPQSAQEAVPDVPAYYRDAPVVTAGSKVERFIEQATYWHAQVVEASVDAWPEAVLKVAQDKQLRRILLGRNSPVGDALGQVLPPEWTTWYQGDWPQCKPHLFDEADAGITSTVAGIARTGTLVLWPGAAEPRTLSLVPPVHIAVLFASSLHETWLDAATAGNWSARMPTNIVLVTGPSKTADIQRMLVYGAHGPCELVIVLVRDEAAGREPA
jgi:L-lactate dehydrogenase complex protein LldG